MNLWFHIIMLLTSADIALMSETFEQVYLYGVCLMKIVVESEWFKWFLCTLVRMYCHTVVCLQQIGVRCYNEFKVVRDIVRTVQHDPRSDYPWVKVAGKESSDAFAVLHGDWNFLFTSLVAASDRSSMVVIGQRAEGKTFVRLGGSASEGGSAVGGSAEGGSASVGGSAEGGSALEMFPDENVEFSNFRFLTAEYNHPDISLSVTLLLPTNVMVVGNEILSAPFVRHYFRDLANLDDRYTITCIGTNIEVMELHSDEYAVVGKDGIQIKKI